MKFKSIFISDIHLGTKNASTSNLLNFIRDFESDNLFLIGDIIDLWRLKSSWYWSVDHNTFIQKILRKSRKGTKVVYILGNHDEFLRSIAPVDFGGIEIVDEYLYISNNKKIWLIHGDLFDGITKYHKWLALFGDYAYTVSIKLNKIFNKFRSKFGLGYWSLSSFLKNKVKQAVSFINDYEQSIMFECIKKDYDAVICGHIHHAEIKKIENKIYMNDGDWYESCTAIVETYDGEFWIIQYQDQYNYKIIKKLINDEIFETDEILKIGE